MRTQIRALLAAGAVTLAAACGGDGPTQQTGPVTVKFAVGRDGAVGRIEVLAALPDRRIETAIVRALTTCRWRPGADASGQPIALWVILPIRFEGG